MAMTDSDVARRASARSREATRTTSFRVTLIISAVALAAIIVIANLGDDDDDDQSASPSPAPTPAPRRIERSARRSASTSR